MAARVMLLWLEDREVTLKLGADGLVIVHDVIVLGD